MSEVSRVAPVPLSTGSTGRWRGLDAFRGFAVIGMLLVNNPGDHDAVYVQLQHSAWNGCTLADLVFPFFLVVVGITTAISLGTAARGNTADAVIRARIWRRAALIFAIGLLLNWFPFYQSGRIAWSAHPTILDRAIERLLLLRIPGVLQRIAAAYLAAALISRRATPRRLVLLVAGVLVGYWALLTIVPVPGEVGRPTALLGQPSRTIVAHLDRTLFDWRRFGLGNHLWDSALTWDPEGVLATVPAIATVLIGVICGRWMRATPSSGRCYRDLFTVGAATAAGGLLWSVVFPLNKALWTSSYVLFTAGIALMLLVVTSLLLDRWPGSRCWRPFVIFGENPLIAYAGSELARRILHSSIKIATSDGRLGTDEWMTRRFEALALAPRAASLAWSLVFVGAWLAALAQLSRRRVLLRV